MDNPTLNLRKDEADYLRTQFLHVPVMKNTLMEYCLKTKTSFDGVALDDIPTGDIRCKNGKEFTPQSSYEE